MRSAGLKIVPRFTYNFPLTDEFCPTSDAPLARVLQHIEQLKPIFGEYWDVIMAVQAGFIGAWGEWHCSSNQLDTLDHKQRILEALLGAVQIRYMDDLVYFYPRPLTAEQAFDGSTQSRVGFHNDCFLANASDAGTYKPPDQISAQKAYAAVFTEFVSVGARLARSPRSSGAPAGPSPCARWPSSIGALSAPPGMNPSSTRGRPKGATARSPAALTTASAWCSR